jgi:hypothetical protein
MTISLDGCSRLQLDGPGDDGIVVGHRGIGSSVVKRPAPGGPELNAGEDAMSPQALEKRVDRLEERVTTLEQLPGRLDALTFELSQFRIEVRDEFSALLKMRFFSFGEPFAVKQISPVLFDGSGSRGEGLTYYLEFGDGQSTTAASATHPMQKEGKYVARLTVVDRYGRSDSETRELEACTLVNRGYYNEWSGAIYPGLGGACGAYLVFDTQEATSVSGHLHTCDDRSPSPDLCSPEPWMPTVRSGFNSLPRRELTGTVTLPDFSEGNQRMELTYHGGIYDGRTVSPSSASTA